MAEGSKREVPTDPQGPNPAPIEPRSRNEEEVKALTLLESMENGLAGLSLVISVALIPLVGDIVARSISAGHLELDLASFGFAGLAITFAALVRVLSRARGMGWIGPLLAFSTVQALVALMYSKAFSGTAVTHEDLLEAFSGHVNSGSSLTADQAGLINQMIANTQIPPGSVRLAAITVLSVTSLLSAAVLTFYWLPRQRVSPPRRGLSQGREG